MKSLSHEPVTLRELWLCLTVASVCFAMFHVSTIPTIVVIPFLVLGAIGRYVSRVRIGWLCGTLMGASACFVAFVVSVTVLSTLTAIFGRKVVPAGGYAVLVIIIASTVAGAIFGGRRAAIDFRRASERTFAE